MLNKWKSSWSRLLGQGSLKLHQQFCLAPIVGSYFHDLSISSNDCDHLVFLTLYAWLILSFFLVIKNFLFTVRLTVRGGGGLIYPYHLIATVSARIKLDCLHSQQQQQKTTVLRPMRTHLCELALENAKNGLSLVLFWLCLISMQNCKACVGMFRSY